MTRHRPCIAQSIVVGLFSLLALVAAGGCDPTLGVPEGNRPPTADARVLGMIGQNAVVDYKGTPTEVTLDGSNSKDAEGPIKVYRWESGTRKPGSGGAAGAAAAGAAAAGRGGSAGVAAADEDAGTATGGRAGGGTAAGGTARWVPDGAPKDWPADVAQPKVMLAEGDYVFVLWVEDERGVVSMPSTLKVSVRTPLDPAVEACTKKVYPEVSSACKGCVCGVNEMCQTTLTNATVCDATCWGFLACLRTKCPDFRAGGDTGCLINMCADLLGGSTGATMIAPCVTPCATQCRSM
jgi:hypothetical protein